MRSTKPGKIDRKHPEVARDVLEETQDVHYANANRDRALGEADRTGRHYDEEPADGQDEGSAASEDHEAD